uniref:Uncharacterized protein LOC100181331 n=1 Tax=Phallusia mammillata TaxID=59560 RepID=A0A6F9DGR4_9ASCI|nr:uncharacterized protein LOC100181331 [Phallusia mammillata]
MACCRRRGDFSKCIPIYIVGLVFLIAGIPLMIVGIATTEIYSDFLGYVGGASTFFGVMFLFLWHMITIPALEKKVRDWDLNVLNMEATTEALEKSRQQGKVPVYENLAYEKESSLPGAKDASLEKPLRSASSSSNDSALFSRAANVNQNNSNNCVVQDLECGFENEAFVPEIATISGSNVIYQSGKVT